jgi:DNA-binding NarL/FixJ family response regulator
VLSYNAPVAALPEFDARNRDAGVLFVNYRILIVDELELVHKGIAALVQSRLDWQVCGYAKNVREAANKADRLKPDLIIMELLDIFGGVQAVRQLLRKAPSCKILIFTRWECDFFIYQLLQAGVSGLLFKSDSARDLMVAIDEISHNRMFFTNHVTKLVLTGYLARHGEIETDCLTSRELQIVQLIAEGRSTKEISVRLDISKMTAVTHRTNINRKLNVRSTVELIHYAIRNGIISVLTAESFDLTGPRLSSRVESEVMSRELPVWRLKRLRLLKPSPSPITAPNKSQTSMAQSVPPAMLPYSD